jgi:uncharacterized membrane protein
MNGAPKQRLTYIDWMRGLACVVMFQTHCYDSWLGGAARQTHFFMWSQLGGTLPAPLFLFLAGISAALGTDRLRQKGIPAVQIAHSTMKRGWEIFGLALLFRVQEFVLGQPWAPWTDLLRVDILNTIGLSIVLMSALSWVVARMRNAPASQLAIPSALAAAVVALSIALLTPPLWTTWRPRWLPWWLESYINGVHIYRQPQPWLFPLFPWAGFAFAGMAAGFLLMRRPAREHPLRSVAWIAAAGALLGALAWWLDAQPLQLYAVYDFWHTSPNFFLIRVGILCAILLFSYAWCRWGLAALTFSPLVQMGTTSLLVYWVHIEFVYGRFSILAKRSQTIASATFGLAVIFTAMLLLSLLRTNWKGRGREILGWIGFRTPEAARPSH